MTISKPRGRPQHPDILTPSEWRVADGVRHGLTNPQIAKRSDVTLDAVKYHVSNILVKLGMQSRSELRVWNGLPRDSLMRKVRCMESQTGIKGIGQIARSVSDISEARRWYGEVLGLEPLMDAGKMAFFACQGVRLMLSEGEPGHESIIYFEVHDIQIEYARMEKAGAKVLSAPHLIHTHEDGSEEWMAFVEDHDGRPIGLMSKARPT